MQNDLILMTSEVKNSRVVINLPFNRMLNTFHDYAFILFKDSMAAAQFCHLWDKKKVTGIFGYVSKIQIHKANHSAKEFLTRILRSKSVFDADPLKRPCFFFDTKEKAKYLLSILEITLEQFVEQFSYLKVNSDFDIFFESSSL